MTPAAAAEIPARPPRRTVTALERPAEFEPPELVSAHPIAATTPDAPSAAPLDSRIVPADGKLPVIEAPLPSRQLSLLALAPAHTAPWEAVNTSAASAADDVVRRAVAAGARARSAGISIGRFVTRASRAGANVF